MGIGAIIAIVIKYLPYLVEASKDVPQLITFVSQLRAIFSRTKPWTPALAAEFDAKVETVTSKPEWQITD